MKNFKDCLFEKLLNLLENAQSEFLHNILLEVIDKHYMNNVYPKDTGLESAIWIEELPDNLRNKKHSDYRIKVADKNNPNPVTGIPVTFVHKIDDSEVIPSLVLSSKGKRKLKKWLFDNEDILKRYMDRKIDKETLIRNLKKVK